VENNETILMQHKFSVQQLHHQNNVWIY